MKNSSFIFGSGYGTGFCLFLRALQENQVLTAVFFALFAAAFLLCHLRGSKAGEP